MTERMTGGEAIVRSVLRHGVDTIFGLPGVQTYPIFDALQRHSNQIRTIGVRHEQTAAYMAMGYAKATGKPGVFSVVPGPGVLNASAALLTGATTNAPMMMLTGEIPSYFLGRGRGHLHELPDQAGLLRTFIKSAERVARPAEAPAKVEAAWHKMLSGRPGPVSVEMCWDTLAESETVALRDPVPPPPPPAPDEAAIEAAVALIAEAKRPMILVSAGAQHAGAEVLALADALGAPVTAFRGGRGIIAADNPLAASTVAAWDLWQDTDLLIGIGSRCEMPAMRWTGMTGASAADRLAPPRKLIRIEIEAEELLRLKPDVGIVADSAAGTRALTDALKGRVQRVGDTEARIAAAEESAAARVAEVQPAMSYLKVLRDAIPRDGILVKDICQVGFASYFGYPVYEPRSYVTSSYQGNLGYGFPTALGAKVGCPDKPVVAVVGDGGFLMAATELSTAAQHRIGLVTVVFNNSAYGNVQRDQQTRFAGRTIASDLPPIDYLSLAASMGVAAERVDSPEALAPVLKKAIDKDAPALIEVTVDASTEVNPWKYIVAGRA